MVRFFAPGSITLFFEIKDKHSNLLKQGSRGVGIATALGAISMVEKAEKPEVYVNNAIMKSTVQDTVMKLMGVTAKVSTILQLPMGAGFGMSAAATISTVLGLNYIYGQNRNYFELLQIAHLTEIKHKTGLGDVETQGVGGVAIRYKEGAPPYGIIDHIVEDKTLVLLSLKATINTRSVLTNPVYRKKISTQGRKAMAMFLKRKTLEYAFDVGLKFSKSTGLLSTELDEIIKKAQKFGKATMSLIGNALVAVGDTLQLQDLFERYGKVYITKIYNGMPGIV